MITYVGLSPHPPLIIPEVGGEKAQKVVATIQAMQAMVRELLADSPDTVVFLTPHGNVFSDCITCLTEADLSGDLGNFGRPDVHTNHPNDLNLVRELMIRAEQRGINVIGIDREMAEGHQLNPNIDHGILVPLYYLEKAGMEDKSIVAISVGDLDNIELYALGRVIQESADSLGKRVAIIASGDMSHRLQNEGPYEFHPDGLKYDLTVKELLSQHDVPGLLNIPAAWRDNAGECGYRSIVIMLGTLDGFDFQTKVFAYEGPYGVGYLTAGLHPGEPIPSILAEMENQQASLIENWRAAESQPVKWARMTLESYIKNGCKPDLPKEMESLLQERAGAFVSIKKHGQLRGCIGTFLPVYKNLAEEIRNNALAAGLQDPRFPPIEAGELVTLVYSVDILAEPEPCKQEDLDPKTYGVIVSSKGKRGLLLPDLEGVETVAQQLQIALQKGGIAPYEQYSLQRFKVNRFR